MVAKILPPLKVNKKYMGGYYKMKKYVIVREIVIDEENGNHIGWDLTNREYSEKYHNDKNVLFKGTYEELIQWNKDHNRRSDTKEGFMVSFWDK